MSPWAVPVGAGCSATTPAWGVGASGACLGASGASDMLSIVWTYEYVCGWLNKLERSSETQTGGPRSSPSPSTGWKMRVLQDTKSYKYNGAASPRRDNISNLAY